MAAIKKKENRGGYRINGGRKPAEDPKEPIFIYIKGSVVKRNGGKKALKILVEQCFNEGKKIVIK